MNTSDKKIAEVLAAFGEPMAGNVWRVQGTAVIYHKTLERIAAQAKIYFPEPKIIRAEKDEAIIQVTGYMKPRLNLDTGAVVGFERMEWSIGEALLGTNYRVSGKQAAYVYAIAEKRAKDRVILKLIELHGFVYSEEEADEFKEGRPARDTQHSDRAEGQGQQQRRDPVDEIEHFNDGRETPAQQRQRATAEDDLKQKIKKAKTINAVTDLMLHADTQKALNELPEGVRDEIRDFAKARLVEMGWPTKSKPKPEPEPSHVEELQNDEPEPIIRSNPEDRQPPEDEGLASSDGPKLFSPEESMIRANAMVKALNSVKTRAQLSEWAQGAQKDKPRLQPSDRDRIQQRYEKRRDEILAKERA